MVLPNALSNFRVTEDGSTDINTVEDFVILTGNGVDTTVWGGTILVQMVPLNLQN